MNELHLFAGAGGGILGGMLLGHRCIGAVENLRGALHTCLWAMRQPLDGWKGDCERKAMDKANAALAQIEQERSK